MALQKQAEEGSLTAKRERLRAFFDRLALDETLGANGPRASVRADRALASAGAGSPADAAGLLTGLLRERGIADCVEQLVEHVLRGGSVEAFLQRADDKRR
ncbi:hypothetical protein NYE40_18840 [Paenibacillus sp. FSL W8-1187]|uniref:Uncharacterized protein n=1 Tax=Paenibacillus pasadenensis TaxID=217090 RepID=A0A2N5NAK3_9BACL|nr:hypothetical protein [Paenibacillus pasadenensis]PLT47334.1 hypothetical protein B8V81_1558 [Paenibacillus pasadenensis]